MLIGQQTMPVSAADSPLMPVPRDLKLPSSAFPHGALIGQGPVSAGSASFATALHPAPLGTLGWRFGYAATGRWTIPRGQRAVGLTLHYVASLFNVPADAAAAAGDARTSLWEVGRVTSAAGGPRFTVAQRNRQTAVYDVGDDGPVEYELSVLYPQGADSASVHAALGALQYAGTVARRTLHHFVTAHVPAAVPVDSGSLPPIEVPPLGTGPVAESPSLMTVDTAQAQPETSLDVGAFRPQSDPAVRALAAQGLAVAPGGAVSRFARTATVGDVDGLYETTALYGNAASARAAMSALQGVNSRSRGVRAPNVDVYRAQFPRLTLMDTIDVWRTGRETILAMRYANVIMVLAETRPLLFDAILLADRLIATIPTPLHADGTHIVDAAGYPVHLAGLNWYGFDEQDYVVGGLDYKQYMDILSMMKAQGYNSIRLPFSQDLVEHNPTVTKHVGANPELVGLHALDIMDRIIAGAGALGLRVILDNHRSEAGWSSEENGLWYTPAYPAASFTNDWIAIARRYAATDTVVGADLRNEPHGAARWGTGDPTTDWKMAAETAGNAVLDVAPNLLIIVEGVEYYGTAPGYWWGGNLMGVAAAPVVLHFADGSSAHSRLVYSAHDYGKDNCGTGCPWFNASTSYASLSAIWDQYWGYIAADPIKPYAAPVWLGEFGTCNYQVRCVSDTAPGSQGQWFSSLIHYVADRQLSWSYWAANGTESTAGARVYGALDWYGYFYQGWSQANPLLDPALRSIQDDAGDSATPVSAQGPE